MESLKLTVTLVALALAFAGTLIIAMNVISDRRRAAPARPTLLEYMSAPEYADSRTLDDDLKRTVIHATVITVQGHGTITDCVLANCAIRGPLVIECNPGMLAGCIGTLADGGPPAEGARLTLVRSTMRDCTFDRVWIVHIS